MASGAPPTSGLCILLHRSCRYTKKEGITKHRLHAEISWMEPKQGVLELSSVKETQQQWTANLRKVRSKNCCNTVVLYCLHLQKDLIQQEHNPDTQIMIMTGASNRQPCQSSMPDWSTTITNYPSFHNMQGLKGIQLVFQFFSTICSRKPPGRD